MTNRTKTIGIIAVSVVLAIVLIYFALLGIDFKAAYESLIQADYKYVLISVLMGICAYWFRSERWRLLLEATDSGSVQSTSTFYSVSMNYFWNLLIPRSGEVARCTTLYTLEGFAINKSLGTVITERVIDFICLAFFAILAILFNYKLFLDFIENANFASTLGNQKILLTIVFVSVLLLVLIYWQFRHRIKQSLFYKKIQNFAIGLKQGIQSVFKLKRKGLFLLYTLGIWVLYFWMTYIIVYAFPETQDVSITQGLFIFLMGGIGMIIPASGGVGAYHSSIRLGFVLLGYSPAIGISFAFLIHTPHTLIALVLGVFSIIMMAVNKKKKKSING